MTVEKVETLAGILKGAGYKSAASYLHEYKVAHIENGFEVPAQLQRRLAQCRRACERGKGPTKRAAEVPEERRRGKRRILRYRRLHGRRKGAPRVPFAADLFEFGAVWMLREIEINALHPEHILLDESLKRVTLVWPSSKTDQEGQEVCRVLQCCGYSKCSHDCAYHVSSTLVTKVKAAGYSYCSVLSNGTKASKAQLIAAWRELYGGGVSGHSARRTGALTYVRKGWALPQIAYLGRWKSNVIYQYAEEALQSLPVNSPGTTKNSSGKGEDPSGLRRKRDLDALKAHVDEQLEKVCSGTKGLEDLKAEVESIKRAAKPGLLPRRIQSISTKVTHANMDMSVCSPPQAWRTRCGWSFYGAKAVFLGEEAAVTCAKCLSLLPEVTQCKEVEEGDL